LTLGPSLKQSIKYTNLIIIVMKSDTVTIPRREYEDLKTRAEIDVELLTQLMESFNNIKEGKVRRVK